MCLYRIEMGSPGWGMEGWGEVRKSQLVIVSVRCHSQALRVVLNSRYTALMVIKAFEEEKKISYWLQACSAVQ